MKTVELSFKVACLFEGTLLICPLYEESSSFLETKLDWEIGSKKMESRLRYINGPWRLPYQFPTLPYYRSDI